MAAVVTSAGITSWLASGLTLKAWLQTLTCRLFQNNYTPTVLDVPGNYTEATFSGYAAQTMPTWTDAGPDANNNEQFTSAQLVWTLTSTAVINTIYGYYWTDANGNVCAAEAAASSFGMTVVGYQYAVNPAFYVGQLAGSP